MSELGFPKEKVILDGSASASILGSSLYNESGMNSDSVNISKKANPKKKQTKKNKKEKKRKRPN